jgi:hypothetical protein
MTRPTSGKIIAAKLRHEHRELIVRNCLAEAYGEPGYAVALIYHRIDDELERRRAVNFLWHILPSYKRARKS